MVSLPTADHVTNSARTVEEMQQVWVDLLDFIAQLLGGKAETTLMLAGGAITPTGAAHLVDTEAAAATDNLTTLVTTNIPDGGTVLLTPAHGDRTPVVKHLAGGAGQISLVDGADFSLDVAGKRLLLKRRGTDWEEVFRSWGNDREGYREWIGAGSPNVFDSISSHTDTFTISGNGDVNEPLLLNFVPHLPLGISAWVNNVPQLTNWTVSGTDFYFDFLPAEGDMVVVRYSSDEAA